MHGQSHLHRRVNSIYPYRAFAPFQILLPLVLRVLCQHEDSGEVEQICDMLLVRFRETDPTAKACSRWSASLIHSLALREELV